MAKSKSINIGENAIKIVNYTEFGIIKNTAGGNNFILSVKQ